MRSTIKQITEVVQSIKGAQTDAFVISGIASIGYGVWQISPPVAFIVVGCILLSFGLVALAIKRKSA